MLLYVLNDLYHIFRGVGTNDFDGQQVIAYKILSFALLQCMKQ